MKTMKKQNAGVIRVPFFILVCLAVVMFAVLIITKTAEIQTINKMHRVPQTPNECVMLMQQQLNTTRDVPIDITGILDYDTITAYYEWKATCDSRE